MHRIGLALLFALTTAVPGGTQQKNTPSTSQGGVYPSRAQLVGTWRLISRAVKLEDGTGRTTWRGNLAVFLFLWHISERLYTYRQPAVQKGDSYV